MVRASAREAGFTLVETLITVTILAIMVSVTGLAALRLYAAYEADAHAQLLASEIATLPARAVTGGRDLALMPLADADAEVAARTEPTTPPAGARPVSLPDGPFRVIVDAPLVFQATGGCRGGQLRLAHERPERDRVYEIRPPACRLVRTDAR